MAKWYKGRFSELEWEDFYAEYAKDDEYYTLFALQSTGH